MSAARVFAALGFTILIGSYVVNAMDRTLFPLLLPEGRREYGFNLPEAGLMSTVFTIGMALAGLPTGYLMSRYARKSVAQIGMFIFSAATPVTVLATGFGDMLFYRALTGIGEAMQLTALLAIVSSFFPNYRAAGIGALNCSYGVGAVLGPLLGAAMLSTYGTWRGPMIGFGIIGFASMGWLPSLFATASARSGSRPAPSLWPRAAGPRHCATAIPSFFLACIRHICASSCISRPPMPARS